ncbi:HlyD family efflux transporter periplasmic adaptor subunit [Actinomycetospora endophytica]|uniref:HlyD family efflux transporter periplasmic adaptor subunit n=1 Tax=Actinomycetospora endophytica TaxID=2291215 RepID=A0ABS8P7J2_9PSEU|nr:HlyD family efflux transporter periplasmic adaptor subunit [Actinomycetospora endophytica]MCD2194208.1 HlyD family efflux transporter periplasmic adaptor subunit [Actinomycetospora endophytica]
MPSAGISTVVSPAVRPPRRPRRRRRPIVAVVLLVVLAAAVGLALLGGDSPFAPQTAVPVVRGTVTSEVSAPGSVVSATSSAPGFAADGTVAAVDATVGMPVRTGDVLATLDDGTARARAGAAAATLAADQRARDAAAAVPVPDPVALARLDAAIATDRVGVTESGRALDATVLRAPQDGTVTEVGAHPGDRITAASPPAVHIADLTTLVVRIGVGPRDVAAMAAGETATVSVDGGPPANGQVADVAPAPGPDGRYTVAVDAMLPPTARIGQPAAATVILDQRPDVLVVPAAAVQPGGTVLVSEPDGIRPHAVTVGLVGREGVEILDGLAAGQFVVVSDPAEATETSVPGRTAS